MIPEIRRLITDEMHTPRNEQQLSNISRTRNDWEKPENRGAFPFGRPHPCFQGPFQLS
jgi:hypothetical protein